MIDTEAFLGHFYIKTTKKYKFIWWFIVSIFLSSSPGDKPDDHSL